MQVTGDLGGITYVQKRGLRRTSYAKTYPKKTPSHLQEYRRARFKAATSAYHRLSNTDKKTLNDITNILKMCMSGWNLFISCYLTGQDQWITDWANDYNLPWSPHAQAVLRKEA